MKTLRYMLLALFLALAAGSAAAQGGSFYQLPEDVVAGGKVFMKKGCSNCHSIQGLGGVGGPDLTKVRAAWSFLDLGGLLWNHSPRMSAEFKRRGMERPQLTEEEMFELMAFVFFLNSFGEPGDPVRGGVLFSEKKCDKCHSVGGNGAAVGTPLDKFKKYRSPAFFSAFLWNKADDMARAMRVRGIERPVFRGDDIADILAYVTREAYPVGDEKLMYLSPGSPKRGGDLFREKGCVRCHAVRGKGGRLVRDLTGADNLSEMAGAVLNHGPGMWESLAAVGTSVSKFSAQEMLDIITYLHFSKFFDLPGDAEKGRSLFSEKGCASCHSTSPGEPSAGPNVRDMKMSSAAGVIAAMWNHASKMEEVARTSEIAWPQLGRGEMRHLVAFIRSKSASAP